MPEWWQLGGCSYCCHAARGCTYLKTRAAQLLLHIRPTLGHLVLRHACSVDLDFLPPKQQAPCHRRDLVELPLQASQAENIVLLQGQQPCGHNPGQGVGQIAGWQLLACTVTDSCLALFPNLAGPSKRLAEDGTKTSGGGKQSRVCTSTAERRLLAVGQFCVFQARPLVVEGQGGRVPGGGQGGRPPAAWPAARGIVGQD